MKNKRKLLGLTATASLLSLSAVLASCGKTKQYTVTFKNGTETVEEQPVNAGFNAKVPTTPTSGDLEFNGWYADEAKTTPFDFGSVINADTTVYANWVNKYTVTFNSNGGSTVQSATVKEGYNVTVPTSPTKAGHVFEGWFADANLTTPFDFGSIITKATTVYAKWELATYNVTLYKTSTEVYKTVGVKDGELLEVGENPAINYKTFVGWYTDPSCSDETLFDITSDLITEDTSLYAKFAPKTEEVEYKFDYQTMIDKYGEGTKCTQIEKLGGFYVNTGAYAEYKTNYVTSEATQPDINNQQQPVWFTSQSAGQFSFDWRYRSGSSCQVKVYEVDPFEDNSVAPTLASMNEDNVVYNKTSGNAEHVSINIKANKTYIVFSVGSVQIHKLAYTNTVGASQPTSISVSGALNTFLCGDEFVSTGLSVTLGYENGRTESVAAREVTCDTSAVDFTREGTYTVTVNYVAADDYGTYPLSDTYEIKVYAVDNIQAYTYSLNNSRETVYNKLVYAKGDALKTNGVYVHAVGAMGEGDAATTFDDQLATSEWELANTVDMTTLGRKTVTLKYKYNPEVTTSFDVEVVDKLFSKTSTSAQVVVDASVEAATKLGESSYTFKSITEALQYFSLCELPAEAHKVIVLKAGTYNEKVYIDMPNVTIVSEAYVGAMPNQNQVGAGENCPVITFDKMNGLKAPNGTQYSTDGAATFTISKKATNCTVCGVKIMNYYNTNALYQESLKITRDTQATACLVRGDMATFAWVTLSGYHDTLYADNGRQMYYNCDIEGRTDFIFGSDATAYFEGCTIRTLGAGLSEKNGGYVVATKGKAGMNFGYIFNDCNFIADEATQAGCVSIARGWDSNMKIMVMNCNLGAHFSKGTYGQTYYEKTVTADTFANLLSTGLYTEANGTYTKVPGTAEFDAEATYYVQLNDRYTKMNADPTPTLLFEYNNEGNGAIQYTAELAAKYVEKTFTLLNPADTQVQAAMADYEEMNVVFKADNGAVKYTENWNPLALLNPTVLGSVTVNGMDGVNATIENFSLSLTNVYVGNTLVESQITTIKNAVKKALNDGYSLVGLYTDAEFTTEFTTDTVLSASTQIYARIVEGVLEVVDLAHYAGANVLASTEGVNADEVWTASAEKDGSEKVSSVVGAAVKKTSDTTDETYATFERSASLTTLKSPKVTDEDVNEVSVVAFGGTASTSNSMKVEIKAYDAAGNVVATKDAYTPGGKVSGYLTTTADGDHTKETKITLKSTTTAISYVTVKLLNEKADGGSADSKSFTFSDIQVTYEKIVKQAYKIETKTYNLKFGTYASDTTTTAGVLDGTGNEWLTVNGTDSKWKSGSPSSQFELGKVVNGSYLKFTVVGTATLDLEIKNNSGTNECHIGVSSTDPTLTAGPTWVKGSTTSSLLTETEAGDWKTTSGTKATVSFTLEAGTYYIANNFERAVRITGIKLVDKVKTPITAETTTTVSLDLTTLTSPVEKGTTQGIFTIYGKDNATLTADNRKVTISENATYGKYLSLAGGTSTAYGSNEHIPANCVGITCSGAGTIKVKLTSKLASDAANYTATNKDNKAVLLKLDNNASVKVASSETKVPASDQAPVEFEFTVTEAGTYYVGISNDGCYVYEVSFTAAN